MTSLDLSETTCAHRRKERVAKLLQSRSEKLTLNVDAVAALVEATADKTSPQKLKKASSTSAHSYGQMDRKTRNRISAEASRKRKAEVTDLMAKRIKELEEDNANLSAALRAATQYPDMRTGASFGERFHQIHPLSSLTDHNLVNPMKLAVS
jgi:hypothetical protein